MQNNVEVQGHAGVIWGHLEVNFLGNVLGLPNLVKRTTDLNTKQCWGQRSCRGHRGHLGVNFNGNVLGPPNLVRRTTDLNAQQRWGQRSCWGHRGYLGGNFHRNVLGPPNLVRRTTDLNAEQCWGPRSCRGYLGSSRGQVPWECPRTTKLGKKNHWPKHKTMLRSKVMQGSSGVI